MEIYFDNAATSHPKPETVHKAVLQALSSENANPGRSGHARAIGAAERILRARETIADFLNVKDPFEIAFTFNCTDALNLGIKGILKKGDHVIASVLEHNSVLRVLGELMKKNEIEVSFVSPAPDGFIDPVDYSRHIRKNTALMILTHASNVTGAIQPIKAACTLAGLHGIPCLIDGAQAAGEIKTDLSSLGCDLYAFPGHKALLGPQGTGGLYIKSGLSLKPLREGGTGTDSESIVQPSELPERYEAGTLNLPGIAGLGEGVRFVSQNFSKIEANIKRVSQYILEEISKIKGVRVYSPSNMLRRTGIVLFNVNDLSSQETAGILNTKNISVRAGLHCAPLAHRFLNTEKRGAVRISCGWYNTFEEAETLIREIHKIAHEKRTADIAVP